MKACDNEQIKFVSYFVITYIKNNTFNLKIQLYHARIK